METTNDVWNLWDVKPPPVCTVKTDLHFKGISDLKEVTFDALETLKDFGHLDKEAAILSRLLYKYKRIFRHDKGIQTLVKVNQCLKRYLKLDLNGLLSTFKRSLPHIINRSSTLAYLPTKQMLKWILLRLQAFAQLFSRIIDLSKITGAYIYRKLCLGWSLNLSLLIFCITARILAAAKFLVAKSIEWYSSFYKCLPHLRQTAEFFTDYKFPSDLKVWLGKVDLIPLKKKTLIDDVFELIDLAKEDEEEEDESQVKILNEKFVKTLFKTNLANVDSDIEEIAVEVEKEVEREVKRPLKRTIQVDEDLGIPVDDDDDDGNDAEEQNRRDKWRRKATFKKKKKSRRVKWLKKLKKV